MVHSEQQHEKNRVYSELGIALTDKEDLDFFLNLPGGTNISFLQFFLFRSWFFPMYMTFFRC